MYVAIVDDSKADATQTKELVEKYLTELLPKGIKVFYEFFASGEEFLQHFSPGHYAFIILDIYMYELNGMEVAKNVAAQDKNCNIIFLTTSTEHVLSGYSVHAAGYVLKPLAENNQQLCQAIKYCLGKVQLSEALLIVHMDNVTVTIHLDEIYYLDCQKNRFVLLHMANHSLKTSSSYQECLDQLQDDRFLECYHRLLVNMDCITAMREDTFLLKNGDAIPISRRKKSEVKQAYLNYLSEH